MTRQEMLRLYAELTVAHKYIVGFIQANKLYYAIINGMLPDDILKDDRCSQSKGGYAKIRVRLDSWTKAKLIGSKKAILLGDADILNSNDKYNKGERFERIITEKLTDKTWTKDSVPFWMAGDIEINGEQIQIKLDGAELTNERTIARAAATKAA